jgi:secreted PhoX family phosphatase
LGLTADPDDRSSSPDVAPCFQEVLTQRLSRRGLLKLIAAGGLMACVPRQPLHGAEAQSPAPELDFAEIPHGRDDTVHVPSGHDGQVLLRWGDPLFADMPDFDPLAQDAAGQRRRFGYNNDFVAFMPFRDGVDQDARGLLVVNHESTQAPLMFPGSPSPLRLTRPQCDVEIAAHGISVVEVRHRQGQWRVQLDSSHNRRVTPETPARLSGPAAGHPRLRTSYSSDGVRSLGTYGNCAGGVTPWGTVLTAEENVQFYFTGDPRRGPEAENYRRFGRYGWGMFAWGRHYSRWNLEQEPREPLHTGWIVEIDPYDAEFVPRKRTALGRFKHEGCGVHLNSDGRVVAYMGDDQRFEYIYRFLSAGRFDPHDRAGNLSLLDEGELSVADFRADGTVVWHALTFGHGPLTPRNGFHSQADVVLDARRAADLMGATRMDRPEEVEVNPLSGEVFVMLTKNQKRASTDTDAVNPRGPNRFGHVLTLVPPGGDHAMPEYRWELFLLAGDPQQRGHGAVYHPDISRHGWFLAPDNCAFDRHGRLWITTDGNDAAGIADGIWACATSGARRALTRHFLRAPLGAEPSGPCFTPGDTTLFCAIQHPGEGSTFDHPSTRWPDFDQRMPPRPALVAVTRSDGGNIGG